jgi:hypothetical protein
MASQPIASPSLWPQQHGTSPSNQLRVKGCRGLGLWCMLLEGVGPVWVACGLVGCAAHAVIGCDQLAWRACSSRHTSTISVQSGRE